MAKACWPTPTGDGDNDSFTKKIQKWPKIQHMRAYNYCVRGTNLTKLFHVTCREAGMTISVQLLGAPHPENLGGKNVQN